MAQYPNDPGLDNQASKEFKPTQDYSILTSEGFAAAMELQTKYSYECCKQMMEKSITHTDETVSQNIDDVKQLIHQLEDLHHKDMIAVNESFTHQNTVLRALKDSDDILQAKVQCLNDEIRMELTTYERQLILKKIYHLA